MPGFFDELDIKPKIDRTQFESMLKYTLFNMTLEQFSKLFINEFDVVLEYWKLYNGENAGKNISLLFNPHRLDIKTTNEFSLFDSIKGKGNFYDGLVRILLYVEEKMKRDFSLESLRYSINGSSIAFEFPPSKIRDYLIEYKIQKNNKILDLCGGWGGRMIGTSVVCNSYTCFEPSTKTFEGLNKLYEWIKQFNSEFKADIYKLPFEDSNLQDNYYDFAITSPPYYDTEKYSEEETNSLNRYKTFENWVDGFYLPLMNKTMKALKNNGIFLLNIGSRRYPLNEILLNSFSSKYQIKKIKGKLSNTNGLGKRGEGETFYEIRK